MAGKNRSVMLGWGLLIGTAAGLVWTWRRAQEIARNGAPGLLNWDRVRSVAVRMAQGDTATPGLEGQYGHMVGRSVEEVSAFTGMKLPSQTLSLRILDRQQWLDTNIGNFRAIMQPLEDLYGKVSSVKNPMTLVLGSPIESFLSYQIGLLLGYLAQRVLGQYDISLLGREPLSDGYLYFVEPNIRTTQAQLGLTGTDFSMWVALHETTHAFEFEAHPWLRGYFNQLLGSFLSDLEQEVDHMSESMSPAGLAELFGQLSQGGSWMLWALTPQQRKIFDQMQALMCIVEGYSNLVMKHVGQRILPSFDMIEARVAQRQSQRSSTDRLFARLTGLELKLEQYRLGEEFSEIVTAKKGLPFLQQVWERAENLPTMEEISQPERWIARMGG